MTQALQDLQAAAARMPAPRASTGVRWRLALRPGWGRKALVVGACLTGLAALGAAARDPFHVHAGTLVLLNAAILFCLLAMSRFGVPAKAASDEAIQTVSHDLRAPLAATESYIKYLMLCESGPLTGEQMQLLNTALRNLNRLEHFITDMLDAAKIDAGRMEFRFENRELSPVLQEAITLFRFTAEEQGVTLKLRVLPGAFDVRMDEAKIRQVVYNLVSNALKFTTEGGEITVTASPAWGGVRVTVADTGIGMPKSALDRLFKRFGQVHETATPGTGLGLWIVKGIIEGHGGRVWVESTPGVGSKFHFTLPSR